MNKRLLEAINNTYGNYILPFYWQHGESEELLREGMARIHESGIGAVCVESRPHPDFLGERWWHDMDIIMDEAKQRDMRVWVLDDSHFPSGYANGSVKSHPGAAKKYLTHYNIDVVGPTNGTSFMLKLKEGDELLAVTAGRRDRDNKLTLSDVIDITDKVTGDLICFDVPDGFWCITVIINSAKGLGRPDYINPTERSAVKLFIDTVYEPFYKHYKNDFGKTFAGFFSDEPELGNACGGKYGHRATVGCHDLTLSWGNEIAFLLKKAWTADYAIKLVSLWFNIDHVSPKARYEYMDVITHLYGENFCGQIGDWCREHNVEYIGHVIEDGNCHSATGLGCGHFFRALWGQDMSGIDVVLQQIRPGLDDTGFYNIGGVGMYYGQFFHYGLAKLGSSLGHLDPKKKGRTMCELYGAYGWSEGLRMMRWLSDHMLVRGVNHFVPHAFTMKDFPDPDCPPHFYARGNNPQFAHFKYLMQYMNRVAHLTQGGIHKPVVAILYDAESDWAGKYEPVEIAGRHLATNQIDYEIIPTDCLNSMCRMEDGNLIIGDERVAAFIVPSAEYISHEAYAWCKEQAEQGLKLICLEQAPSSILTGEVLSAATVIRNDALIDYLHASGLYGLKLTAPADGLRYYRYAHEGTEYIMLFNESPCNAVDTVWLYTDAAEYNTSAHKEAYEYDAFANTMYPAAYKDNGIHIELLPGEATVYVLGAVDKSLLTHRLIRKNTSDMKYQETVLDTPFDVSFTKAGEPSAYKSITRETLVNETAPTEDPYFSGTMEYRTTFTWTQENGSSPSVSTLDLGEVGETAEVFLNDIPVGVRVNAPYIFDISSALKTGENQLTVRVTNHLGHKMRDFFSMTMPLEASGLMGPVSIRTA
ncbi:MAG: glycoside hydrolase family 2 [Lachnospiraceae bacterium]|nr:glycoside hydrolase family 2 [Lachnospiraceae bacterium]